MLQVPGFIAVLTSLGRPSYDIRVRCPATMGYVELGWRSLFWCRWLLDSCRHVTSFLPEPPLPPHICPGSSVLLCRALLGGDLLFSPASWPNPPLLSAPSRLHRSYDGFPHVHWLTLVSSVFFDGPETWQTCLLRPPIWTMATSFSCRHIMFYIRSWMSYAVVRGLCGSKAQTRVFRLPHIVSLSLLHHNVTCPKHTG